MMATSRHDREKDAALSFRDAGRVAISARVQTAPQIDLKTPSPRVAPTYPKVEPTDTKVSMTPFVQWIHRRVARISATHLIASDMRNEGECHVSNIDNATRRSCHLGSRWCLQLDCRANASSGRRQHCNSSVPQHQRSRDGTGRSPPAHRGDAMARTGDR